jgi:hypothetical protein
MTIRDANLAFNATTYQAVTASAASTNAIDQGNATLANPGSSGQSVPIAKIQGIGSECYLEVYVRVATFTTCTSIAVSLYSAATNALLESTPVTAATSGAIAVASLTLNALVWRIKLPPTLGRFIGVYYTVAGSNAAAGSMDAYLVLDSQTAKV